MHRRSKTHILHLAHVEPTASVCPLECNAPLRLELVHGTQFTTPHRHPLEIGVLARIRSIVLVYGVL